MNCVMEMAGQTQHFLIILLLSLLISFNTVSASRAAIMIHLGQGQDFPASQAAHQKKQPLQKLFNGRMDLQYGDYPVSEANPRHTPKPQRRV